MKANANPSIITQIYKRSCRAAAVKLKSSTVSHSLADDIKGHFQSVFTPPFVNPDASFNGSRISDHRFSLSNQHVELFGTGDVQLSQWFNEASVQSFFASYNVSKCCGSDSLHTLILKALCDYDIFPSHLAQLFSLCALTGITPERWNCAIVYPLAKTSDASTIADCRPIAITVMFRRAFESILHRFIHEDPRCASIREFGRIQAGFRRGHSTLLHAALSHDIGQTNRNTKRVFVDFRQAYDRVPIHLVLQKLSERNAPPAVTSLITSLFIGTSLDIVANGSSRAHVPMFRGLLQGSVLSPWAFNIFIDDLARSLDAGNTVPNALLLADDLQLISSSSTHLQTMLDTLTNWTWLNGMEVGFAKTRYLSDSLLQLSLCGNDIDKTHDYKYLGFPHKRLGIDFSKHVETMAEKANRALQSLEHKGAIWPQSIRLALSRSFVLSRLDYGLALIPSLLLGSTMSDQIYKPAQATLNSALKYIIPQAASAKHVQALVGICDITSRAQGLAASFCHHILRMAPDHPARHYIYDLRNRPPFPEKIILPHAFPTRLFTEISVEAETNNRSFYLQLKRWYISEIERNIQTAKYISRRARKQKTGADYSLFIVDDKTRDFAVRWRLGCYAINRFCHVCNQPFTRAHPKRCNYPIELPEQHERFIPPHPPDSYGPVDSVLNSMDLERIQLVLEYLDTNVTR